MSKTVIAELKISSADIRLRNVIQKAAVSFILKEHDNYKHIEQFIDPNNPIFIPSVDKFIFITADSFFLDLNVEQSATLNLVQKGMFINTGQIPGGLIIGSEKQTHCFCIYV